MRLLKVLFVGIFAAIAVVVGAVAAAVVAAVALLFLTVRRWLTGQTAFSTSANTRRPAPPKPRDADVIEVSATEVKS